MKRLILIPIFLLALIPTTAFATETSESDYDYTNTYEGRFKSDRLFKRNDRNPIWRPSRGELQVISEINCDDALTSLHQTGTWTGNLSKEGECLGTAEAPERTYGNYLNYLQQKITSSRTSSD
jgi:hypothetical protein